MHVARASGMKLRPSFLSPQAILDTGELYRVTASWLGERGLAACSGAYGGLAAAAADDADLLVPAEHGDDDAAGDDDIDGAGAGDDGNGADEVGARARARRVFSARGFGRGIDCLLFCSLRPPLSSLHRSA